MTPIADLSADPDNVPIFETADGTGQPDSKMCIISSADLLCAVSLRLGEPHNGQRVSPITRWAIFLRRVTRCWPDVSQYRSGTRRPWHFRV